MNHGQACRSRLWAALLVAAALLCGCGSREESRLVRAGLYENAPKIYTNESGQPAGLFVELLQDIAKSEGWRLEFVACQWNDCLRMVDAGRLDLMPDVAFSNERAQRFDFHRSSVASSWSQVFAHPNVGVQKLSDLAGKRVASLKGGIQQAFLDKLMQEAGLAYQQVSVASLVEGYEAVASGAADVVVTNSFFAARNGAKYRLRETPIVFLPVNLYYATGKGRNADLLEKIDRHLELWRQDADSIYFKALRQAMAAQQEASLSRWMSWGLSGLLGLILVLFVTSLVLQNRRIRERVAAATHDLDASRQQLEREVGIKTLLAELTLRIQQAADPRELGRLVLSLLAEQTACRQGLLAVATPRELVVIARYGAQDAAGAERIPLDQGVLGQCVREGRPVHLVLPDDPAWRIRSGLGSSRPAEVWLLPVKHGGAIVGVLEMALLQPLDASARSLVDQLLSLIALPMTDIGAGLDAHAPEPGMEAAA
ncbi:MAG: transporter substrate-binding domain-containing protein [Pseudomonadota bacterium]